MKPQPGPIQLKPAADGWRIVREGGDTGAASEYVATLDEASERIAPGEPFTLALPCRSVLLERLRLPAADADELEGMVRLQLEKTLPYAAEEITGDFEIVARIDGESVVLAAGLHTPQLDKLCRPLRDRQLLPTRVTVYADEVAAACPPGRTTLLLYREQDQVVIAVAENGKLGYAHTVAAADPQILAAELPQILLTAEMEGVPADFSAVYLDTTCARLEPILGPLLGVPVATLSLDTLPAAAGIDLLPPAWVRERSRFNRSERLRSLLVRVGAGVLGLLVLAIGYIVWLQVRVNGIDRKLQKLRPELEIVRNRQERWRVMSPAVDPRLYPVEILFQVYRSLPSEDVRITQFTEHLGDFTVEGEAPSAMQAIQFADKLRENPALEDFTIEAGPPAILPNDHAKFRVFAKR